MAPRRTYPKTTGPMDQWLESQGYYRKHTARDGTCLFRAVSEQVYNTQAIHQDVRRQCVEFIQRNRDTFEKHLGETLEEYATRMMSSKEWGGMLEIKAMALLYKRDVHIFEEIGKLANIATDYGFTKKILLCFSSDNHYDSVYTKSYIVKAAFCQSIAYEVLYRDVFNLSDISYAVNKMLHDKTNRLQKERLINEDLLACGRFGFSMEISLESNREYKDGEDISSNVKELLVQGITPFPYKVAKALDSNIYRNIEFDIWNDYRRELKFGWYRNNGEFQVGVKCLVKLSPERNFHAHIQEMSPDKGPVIVFVEELGEKCTVPYDNLEPLPNAEKPQWSLPYKHCRQLSNIQQNPTLLALSEFGGKWKKSKLAKSRKIKDSPIHAPLSPRLQYNKMNLAPAKYSVQHNNRFAHEQMGNQQIQAPFQNFSLENFNNMHNYSNVNVGVDMPGPMMMEQPRCINNPVISEGMVPLTSSTTITNNRGTNSTTQCTEITTTTSERCMSPVQQPDSTTEMPSSQQSAQDSCLPVDPSLCSQPTSPQYISFATFTNHPILVKYAPVPRPESNAASNSSNCFSDPSSSNNTSPQHVTCNTGMNMNDPQARDVSTNILFQPVNFLASKSVQLSGSDLPLSDIPTLRFYYNLGHDYFRLSCMYWPTSVQQTKTNVVQPSVSTSYNENPGYGNTLPAHNMLMTENHGTGSTSDIYQIGEDITQNFLLPTEQNTHLSAEENKAVCYHNGNSGENENVTWQSKQPDSEVPRALQKSFNSGIASRVNKNCLDGRDERNQHGKSQQNAGRPNEQYDVLQSAQEIENTYGHAVNEVQSRSSNVISNGYSVASPTLPYAYTPALYNHALVPFYFPVDNEQSIVPLQYYPQYTIGPGVQVTSQEATEPAESQTGSSHMAGSVCSENGCFPPCTVYPPPSAPFIFQQPPAGMYPPSNISVPRWVQPASSPPHIAPTPCMFQPAL